jgi:calcineurin-like phosphoesterase family protein
MSNLYNNITSFRVTPKPKPIKPITGIMIQTLIRYKWGKPHRFELIEYPNKHTLFCVYPELEYDAKKYEQFATIINKKNAGDIIIHAILHNTDDPSQNNTICIGYYKDL